MKMQKLVCLLVIFLAVATGCGKKEFRPEVSGLNSPGGSTQKERARSLYKLAEKEFQRRNFTVAMELYEECARKYPDSGFYVAALSKSADLYLMHGLYEKAMGTYEAVIEKGSGELVTDAMIGHLVCMNRSGRYGEAVNESGQLLSRKLSASRISRVYREASLAYGALEADVESVFYLTAAYMYSSEELRGTLSEELKNGILGLAPGQIVSYEEMVAGMISFDELLQKVGIDPREVRGLDGKIYKVGCLFPLTGKYGIYGEKAMKSIELAVYLNSVGGGNISIRLIIKDTESDPEQAVRAVRELYQEGVAAILGPIGTVKEAASEAQRLGVPMIAVTGREEVGSIGNFVFTNGLTHKAQARAIVRHAVEREGIRSFAILYPRKKYGEDLMNYFWDEVESYGLEVKGVESYPTNVTDFAESIKKLVGLHYKVPGFVKEYLEEQKRSRGEADSPEFQEVMTEGIPGDGVSGDDAPDEPKAIVDFDAVFIPDSPDRVGLILPQLLYYDIENVFLLGTNLWHSEKLIKLARREAQGAILPESFNPESGDKLIQGFVSSFEEAFGGKPGYVEAVTFDSATMLFNAIDKAKPLTKSGVRDAVSAINGFPGVTGVTDFDENGDAKKKLLFLKVSGRQFKEMGKR